MSEFTRRRFLQYGAAGGVCLFAPWAGRIGAASAAPGGLAKYLEPLPVPGNGIVVATPSGLGAGGATRYGFTLRQIERHLHPHLPPTKIWAYDDGSGLAGQAGSFGMALVAQAGTPLEVDFTHDLPDTYPAWLPVDERLTPFGTEVRMMTHLHGGFVAAASDGNPSATPNGFAKGQTQTVRYPNDEPQMRASLLWFHDHAMGVTRLNVVAGLAAAYIVRDAFDTGTPDNANGLPSGAYEIPLVVQDRQLERDGTVHYPTSDIPGVTWVGEYFGDVMLVNGKVWPYLDVEPRLYRLRILNGCNARILNLDLGGARMWQIGAEGGLWDRPVLVSSLVLAPAERADVLVDFSRHVGRTTVLRNAPVRRPAVTPAPQLPHVMQIRVANGNPVPPTIPDALIGGLRAELPEPPAARRRFITLNEVAPETDEWRLTVNGAGFAAEPVTETPKAGSIEDWYYVNLTEDTHPMHPHLVTMQVVGRVPFDPEAYASAAGEGPDGVPGGLDPWPFATGPLIPADPAERGFKDTVKANPGSFTIVRAKFDLPPGVTAPQRYVQHCHILEHEENDMMRPFDVIA